MLTSSFANNLFRTPVEFAQASLQLQKVSGGRFEAGLGAGWDRAETEAAGLVYPAAGERAGRYAEAVQIVRQLFVTGCCSFHGRYYDIEVPKLGPSDRDPPPLVASLGGDRTIREIAPLVDRVELKLNAPATRDGSLDLVKLAGIPRSHLADLVAKVRAVNPTVPLGVLILCSVGDDDRTRALVEKLGIRSWVGSSGRSTRSSPRCGRWATSAWSGSRSARSRTPATELLAPHLGEL